jgi:hypothetical protein
MKTPTIKQAALFCVLVLGPASMASASTIAMTSTTYPGGVAAGWNQGFSFTAQINDTVGFDPGFDLLTVVINSMTDVAAGYTILTMEGTWSITGSTFDCPNPACIAAYNRDHGTSYTLGDFMSIASGGVVTPGGTPGGTPEGPIAATLLSPYGQTPSSGPLCYVNLPPNESVTFSEIGGSGQAYTGFTGGWFTSGTGLSAGSTLAVLLVPTGWTLSATDYIDFEGDIGFTYNGGNIQNAELITQTPEPATIVLMATGLVGLLAYAWRKSFNPPIVRQR